VTTSPSNRSIAVTQSLPEWAADRRLLWIIGVLLLLLSSSAGHVLAQDVEPFLGHWEGKLVLPTAELDIKADLALEAGSLTGTLDIPAQGAKGIPLADFAIDGANIRFKMQGIPGDPTFDGTLADGDITGKFLQGGGTFSFNLGREAIPPPNRPQEPKPPFPYDQEEVSYSNVDITLAGTLTLPKGSEKSPAALMITGSGPQNRDEALLGHKPFLVIADHLTRAGIAVLRVDDRGVGGSTGNLAQSTSADFATDVLAGVEFLKTHDRINAGKIGVIGHSEGGIVGPLAASQSDDIAFVVMLAGTGVPGSEILPLQLEMIAKAEGVPQETIDKQLALQNKILALLASDTSTEEIEAPFREVVAEQVDLAIELAGEDTEIPREQAIDQAVQQVLNPWFRFFVNYDPKPALTKVSVPVLVLNGELDTQVDADQNLPEIEKALKNGGNKDFTIKRLPSLNHLFQTATTGAFSEYAKIEETFDPATLKLISDWILKRFG
jgi:pimeloyl-ACP methyl ester carboxylesterase